MQKIFIIEDEETLAFVLKEKFQEEGYKVAIARDGEEALPKAIKFRPDIILLDLILPRKNGLDVLKDLKSDPRLKIIPVFILSNLAGDESIKKGLILGAEDYFVKTQHPLGEIIERIETYFREPKLK